MTISKKEVKVKKKKKIEGRRVYIIGDYDSNRRPQSNKSTIEYTLYQLYYKAWFISKCNCGISSSSIDLAIVIYIYILIYSLEMNHLYAYGHALNVDKVWDSAKLTCNSKEKNKKENLFEYEQ
ncbi:hypothetical protein J3Q64DRAFT_1703701 [Phycomyces blakesleeanus]|uniref:Uncharacterized protein n=2 Tax=Phycomyces blakesleeanus TaxID=4837 RepID=A0A167MRK0_PHYB8|nr:hypothetical protein PHYBLDRAFT_168120 [Phycomyces blakesleeanus NRRL 1555(-)]OAD73684.1 hypothetical protein PHYBLDRAFT_168120 [Phycomyces blakesleeanus NRRL 1555(-)]|eukprot:XP_018291724.1 hypothetical protein PHYBLDRAFT_168120 [Phycomyces blakesleeanus NRRL 1555(-)]